MTKKISVSLPLNKYFLDEIFELGEKITKSFSINLNTNLLCRYHINLFSGKLYNFNNLRNIIKNIKTRLNIPQRPATLTTIGYLPLSGFVFSFINERVFL